jgi:ribosomal protein L23
VRNTPVTQLSMPVSARRAAGIIRNVLPKRVLQRRPRPAVLGSIEEVANRNVQIQKWQKTTRDLLKTPEGRQILARNYPKSYQKALAAEKTPTGAKKPSFLRPAELQEDLKELAPRTHNRIMSRKIPTLTGLPPFPMGKKKVYLPNIVITLRRNAKLEPYHVVFDVPLNLSKLDLRDYLWNLYNVKTLSIRSSVLHGVLRRKYKVPDQPRRIGPMTRTKQRKKMIVQLAKPFQYPRELNDKELEEFVLFYMVLMIGSRRNEAIRPLDGDTGDLFDEKWVSCKILIPCTMYITNGVRWIHRVQYIPLRIYLATDRPLPFDTSTTSPYHFGVRLCTRGPSSLPFLYFRFRPWPDQLPLYMTLGLHTFAPCVGLHPSLRSPILVLCFDDLLILI